MIAFIVRQYLGRVDHTELSGKVWLDDTNSKGKFAKETPRGVGEFKYDIFDML
jgi:hypothetical protein